MVRGRRDLQNVLGRLVLHVLRVYHLVLRVPRTVLGLVRIDPLAMAQQSKSMGSCLRTQEMRKSKTTSLSLLERVVAVVSLMGTTLEAVLPTLLALRG